MTISSAIGDENRIQMMIFPFQCTLVQLTESYVQQQLPVSSHIEAETK